METTNELDYTLQGRRVKLLRTVESGLFALANVIMKLEIADFGCGRAQLADLLKTKM
jgi:hypothetical protein